MVDFVGGGLVGIDPLAGALPINYNYGAQLNAQLAQVQPVYQASLDPTTLYGPSGIGGAYYQIPTYPSFGEATTAPAYTAPAYDYTSLYGGGAAATPPAAYNYGSLYDPSVMNLWGIGGGGAAATLPPSYFDPSTFYGATGYGAPAPSYDYGSLYQAPQMPSYDYGSLFQMPQAPSYDYGSLYGGGAAATPPSAYNYGSLYDPSVMALWGLGGGGAAAIPQMPAYDYGSLYGTSSFPQNTPQFDQASLYSGIGSMLGGLGMQPTTPQEQTQFFGQGTSPYTNPFNFGSIGTGGGGGFDLTSGMPTSSPFNLGGMQQYTPTPYGTGYLDPSSFGGASQGLYGGGVTPDMSALFSQMSLGQFNPYTGGSSTFAQNAPTGGGGFDLTSGMPTGSPFGGMQQYTPTPYGNANDIWGGMMGLNALSAASYQGDPWGSAQQMYGGFNPFGTGTDTLTPQDRLLQQPSYNYGSLSNIQPYFDPSAAPNYGSAYDAILNQAGPAGMQQQLPRSFESTFAPFGGGMADPWTAFGGYLGSPADVSQYYGFGGAPTEPAMGYDYGSLYGTGAAATPPSAYNYGSLYDPSVMALWGMGGAATPSMTDYTSMLNNYNTFQQPSSTQPTTGWQTTIPQARFGSDLIDSLNSVAGGWGANPSALAAIVNLETGGTWDPQTGTGTSQRGVVQMAQGDFTDPITQQPTTRGGLTWEQYQNATPAQQIQAYSDYINPVMYNLSQAGVDFASQSPYMQAAILMAAQLNPSNTTNWMQNLASGNWEAVASPSQGQANELYDSNHNITLNSLIAAMQQRMSNY